MYRARRKMYGVEHKTREQSPFSPFSLDKGVIFCYILVVLEGECTRSAN